MANIVTIIRCIVEMAAGDEMSSMPNRVVSGCSSSVSANGVVRQSASHGRFSD